MQVYALLEGGVGLERDFGVVDSREVKVFDAAQRIVEAFEQLSRNFNFENGCVFLVFRYGDKETRLKENL